MRGNLAAKGTLPNFQSERDRVVYDHYWKSGQHYTPSQTFVRMLGSLASESAEVCIADLGCGIGRHAIYAAERGAKVVAVDHSEQALARLCRHAEERGLSIQAVHGDFVAWCKALFGRPLDGLVCFDAVHHVSSSKYEVVEALQRMARAVRANGLVLVTLLSDIDYGLGGAPKGRLLIPAAEAEDLLDGAFAASTPIVTRRSECYFDSTVNLDQASGNLIRAHYRAVRVIRLYRI